MQPPPPPPPPPPLTLQRSECTAALGSDAEVGGTHTRKDSAGESTAALGLWESGLGLVSAQTTGAWPLTCTVRGNSCVTGHNDCCTPATASGCAPHVALQGQRQRMRQHTHYCRSRDFTTRRAPTPPDASYIPDASGPDTLYDAVRRVVLCRTTLVRHSTTLYDTVRHSTTQYDTVRHSTTQYDTVRHSTTQYDASYCVVRRCYDTVRHCTTLYDASYSVVQCRTTYICIYMYVCMYISRGHSEPQNGPLPSFTRIEGEGGLGSVDTVHHR